MYAFGVLMYSTRKPKACVAHVSMNKDASVFCSRMPSTMPRAIAMIEAEMPYSAQRQYRKASSIWRQYQNHQRSKAPTTSAQKWKMAEVAKKEMTSDARLIGIPLSQRKRPELGSEEVRFHPSPADQRVRLLSIMCCVGMLRMR